MVLLDYQIFIEMTSNMIYIFALGVGFKCPRKIHLNTQWGGEADTPITPYYAVAYCHPPKATGHVFSSFMNHVLAAFLSNIIRKNSIYHTTLWPQLAIFVQILFDLFLVSRNPINSFCHF